MSVYRLSPLYIHRYKQTHSSCKRKKITEYYIFSSFTQKAPMSLNELKELYSGSFCSDIDMITYIGKFRIFRVTFISRIFYFRIISKFLNS